MGYATCGLPPDASKPWDGEVPIFDTTPGPYEKGGRTWKIQGVVCQILPVDACRFHGHVKARGFVWKSPLAPQNFMFESIMFHIKIASLAYPCLDKLMYEQFLGGTISPYHTIPQTSQATSWIPSTSKLSTRSMSALASACKWVVDLPNLYMHNIHNTVTMRIVHYKMIYNSVMHCNLNIYIYIILYKMI